MVNPDTSTKFEGCAFAFSVALKGYNFKGHFEYNFGLIFGMQATLDNQLMKTLPVYFSEKSIFFCVEKI